MATNKRDAARRKLQAELAARQQRSDTRRRTTVVASVAGTVAAIVVVIVVIALTTGGSSKKPVAAAAAATGSSGASAHTPGSCSFVAGGTASRKVSVPAATAPTTGTVAVHVATNRGPVTFTLNRAAAPCTVASFVSLVQQKYYDDTICHRLTTTGIYVLQCGDPDGKGTGGPGYTIPDELSGHESYSRGVLAMANTGAPNSGGSQFFIVYKDTQLPAQYTIFGVVSAGLPVVDAVAAKGSDNANGSGDGHPKLPITLTKLTV